VLEKKLSDESVNRTVNWGEKFSNKQGKRSVTEVLRGLFDDPNVLFLITNQHNNVNLSLSLSSSLLICEGLPSQGREYASRCESS
jgi:hypothetical protein